MKSRAPAMAGIDASVRRPGVGPERNAAERDDSGVILFFLARR